MATVEGMEQQAKRDTRRVRDLSFEQKIAQAQIDAIKEIPGDIAFPIQDKEAKDAKTGKPLVSQWRVPVKVARELYEIQSVSYHVQNRWQELEPRLTEPQSKNGIALFPAPDCFEKLTSDSYQALRRALQSTNARFQHAVGIIQKMAPKKAALTPTETAEYAAAKLMKTDADRAITVAIETMHRHWKNRQDPSENQSGSTRATKPLKSILDDTVNSLGRRAQSKKASQSDRTLAEVARMVLLWVRMDPQAAKTAFLAWESERNAKSQQDRQQVLSAAEAASLKIPAPVAAVPDSLNQPQ